MQLKLTPAQMIERILTLEGFNQPQVAEVLGVSQSTVSRIKEGSQPRYELGCHIESLYESHFGSTADIQSDNNAA